MPIQPIYLKVGCSKTTSRILIFSIAMGAEYLSYVKFIATEAPTFFGYIISVLASVPLISVTPWIVSLLILEWIWESS